MSWQPSASISTLNHRAEFLHNIRNFFLARKVLEVDTPLLCRGVATDPGLAAFKVKISHCQSSLRFLQTSPEFPMKRLIASGSGPIFYLGKSFRSGEVGKWHNPEFTMLEWYRPGWDHFQLIAEVDDLFKTLLDCLPAEINTYQSLFEHYLGIHPHLASENDLAEVALQRGWVDCSQLAKLSLDKDGLLDLLLTHGIEPHLGHAKPQVIIDYPASQASLAKIRSVEENQIYFEVAERFEFYYRGIELANGYHELTCAKEQAIRFQQDLEKRKTLGLCDLPIDHELLAAMLAGMPDCAGVALGVDRLLMLKLDEDHIARVLPFVWENA
jgi:elongation factor P--(R)-beta-lysine ligase